LEKTVKHQLSVGGSASASFRRLGPQTPTFLLSLTITTLSKFISSTKCGLLPSKKNNFCFFQTFAPIFHFKTVIFVDKWRKNISCPRAQDTLATPLLILLLIACLHDQNKAGFFGGRLFFSQSGLFENFSDCSDWLDKSRPSKKATFVLIM